MARMEGSFIEAEPERAVALRKTDILGIV